MSVAEEPFDPYRKWLGIPVEDQPPHHYRLLGLRMYESDPDVISHAADRCMGHVRTFQTGSQVDLCQKILNELAAARLCLLGANTKAQYDRQLQSGQVNSPTVTRIAPSAAVGTAPVMAAPVTATPVTAVPVAATPLTAVPVAPTAVAVSPSGQSPGVGIQTSPASPVNRRRRRNRVSSAPVVLGGIACLALLGGLLAVVLANQGGKPRKAEDNKPRKIIIKVPEVKPLKDDSKKSSKWSEGPRRSMPASEPRYESSDQLDYASDRIYRRNSRLE